MGTEVRNGRTFRLRLMDGETEVKSLMVEAEMPPQGATVTHDGKEWHVAAPVWVLEKEKLFQVVKLTLKGLGKASAKRTGPIRAKALD